MNVSGYLRDAKNAAGAKANVASKREDFKAVERWQTIARALTPLLRDAERCEEIESTSFWSADSQPKLKEHA